MAPQPPIRIAAAQPPIQMAAAAQPPPPAGLQRMHAAHADDQHPLPVMPIAPPTNQS